MDADFVWFSSIYLFLILLLEVAPGGNIAFGAVGPGSAPLCKEKTIMIVEC